MKKVLVIALAINLILLASCSSGAVADPQQAKEESSSESSIKLDGPNAYINKINLADLETDWSTLYITAMPTPTAEEALKIRENANAGTSSYGASKVQLALFNIIESLKESLGNYCNGSMDEYISILENPFYLEDIISALESIKAYITDEDLKEDITSAQSLIASSIKSGDIDGIFYAHHLLSDISYWGFSYGLNPKIFRTWQIEYNIAETDIYYGVSKLWGNDYPSVMNELIESNDYKDKIDNDRFNLNEDASEKDKRIKDAISQLSSEDINTIKDSLDYICAGFLKNNNIMIFPTDPFPIDYFEKQDKWDGHDLSYESLPPHIEKCINTVPDGDLKDDFTAINNLLGLYLGKQEIANGIFREQLAHAAMKALELRFIVFENENPVDLQMLYYASCKTIEGDADMTKKYEYMIGEFTPSPSATNRNLFNYIGFVSAGYEYQ